MNAAIFTITRNESFFLPVWVKYYRRFFSAKDIHILDNESEDDSIEKIKECVGEIRTIPCSTVECVRNLRANVSSFQRELLARYPVVVFAEVDEFLWAENGLREFLDEFETSKEIVATAAGYNIIQHEEEPGIDEDEEDLLCHLRQRDYLHADVGYNKTLISKVGLSWGYGFHLANIKREAPGLFLLHGHYLDCDLIFKRIMGRAGKKPLDGDMGLGGMNKTLDAEAHYQDYLKAVSTPSTLRKVVLPNFI